MKIWKFSQTPIAIRVSRIILLLSLLIAVIGIDRGETALFATYNQYTADALTITVIEDALEGSENTNNATMLSPEDFQRIVATMQKLSKNPIYAPTSDGRYSIYFATTEFRVSDTLSWEQDYFGNPTTLALTPGGILRLPNGTYLLYSYTPKAFSGQNIASDRYLGRLEDLTLPAEAIDSSFSAKVVGWIYFQMTDLGLSIAQTHITICAIGWILFILIVIKPARKIYQDHRKIQKATH